MAWTRNAGDLVMPSHDPELLVRYGRAAVVAS
jgi:hypothetical protein